MLAQTGFEFLEYVTAGSSLAGVLIVVVLFLRHLNEMQKTFKESLQAVMDGHDKHSQRVETAIREGNARIHERLTQIQVNLAAANKARQAEGTQ